MTAQMDETVLIATPCHDVDPDIFFAEAPAEIEYAKTLCLECPLKAACLAAALERREACGVWGGELVVNGTVVARKRPRGRPPKQPTAVIPKAPRQLNAPVRRLRAGRARTAA